MRWPKIRIEAALTTGSVLDNLYLISINHCARQKIISSHAAVQQLDSAAQLFLSRMQVSRIDAKEHIHQSTGDSSPVCMQVSLTWLREQTLGGVHIIHGWQLPNGVYLIDKHGRYRQWSSFEVKMVSSC